MYGLGVHIAEDARKRKFHTTEEHAEQVFHKPQNSIPKGRVLYCAKI